MHFKIVLYLIMYNIMYVLFTARKTKGWKTAYDL